MLHVGCNISSDFIHCFIPECYIVFPCEVGVMPLTLVELRGPTLFLPILVIIIIFFFFLGAKVSSGIWETCPKIFGGYEYQNPPNGG